MTTVSNYLITRLLQLQVNHLFAVPGDYTGDFLAIVDNQNSLVRIGCCNELNAGYAADGYARVNGLGAVCITTGVGAFSALNAIGGSYVENIPVIVIIGTLSNTKLQDEMNAGELFHHNVNTTDFVKSAYRDVTVAFERISNPLMAPAQIDSVLKACISQRKPAAIEIMEDCYYMPCPEPHGHITAVAPYEHLNVLKNMVAATPPNVYATQIVAAVNNAATQVYSLLKQSKKPLLWIGKEIQTYQLQDKFLELLDLVKAPFAASLLGKSAIAENNPWYVGMYDGVFTQPGTNTYVTQSDCVIGIGVWNTDLNVFGRPNPAPGNPSNIFVSRNTAKVGDDLYVMVSLEHFLDAFIHLIKTEGYTPVQQTVQPPPAPAQPPLAAAITYDYFFAMLSASLTLENTVVAETGLSSFGGSSYLQINKQNGFISQLIWASIGWSVPAGLGASFGSVGAASRTMVVTGDGAFKLTCQEISTMIQHGLNTVVFVLNNSVYAVEQILLNPAPFKPGSGAPYDAANILQRWNYVSLMNAFSNNNTQAAMSADVNTVQDLQNVLQQIAANSKAAWLVNVNLATSDYPAAWAPFVNKS